MFQVDYTEWKDTLNKYKAEMEKELAEVRAAKQDLIDLHNKMQEMAFSGRYERDEDTLILSAPNIIIGNVDKSGNLLGGPSNIVLRGHDVALEGVGSVVGGSVAGGSVTTRARNVNIVTVDPGIDGVESVAFPDSSFSVQSAAVEISAEVIDPSPSGGLFTQGAMPVMGCVNIAAETNVNITAACAIEDENIDTMASDMKKSAKAYGEQADASIKQVGSYASDLDSTQNNMMLDLLGAADEDADLLALRTGLYEFDERSEHSEITTAAMSQKICDSTHNLSLMAEGNRIAKYIKARSERLKSAKSTYETDPTGSSVNIASERISMATMGADGKVRTAPGNGLFFKSQNTVFSSLDEGLVNLPDSTFKVIANDIIMNASDYTYEAKDDKLMATKIEAKGRIMLNAKEIDLLGNDATFEPDGDNVKTIPTLAKDSLLYVNCNNTQFDMADEEGKAQGVFLANAKDVYITSYDIDKESRVKPTAVTDGGKVSVGAKEVYLGSVIKDMKAETVQIASKNVNLLGEEKVNLQQEKDKSHLLLDDNAELSGGEVKVVGKISLGGETKIDAKFTAGDIEAKNVKASSSVSGPNMKDGIPVPAPAAPAQPGKGAALKELAALEKLRDTSGESK